MIIVNIKNSVAVESIKIEFDNKGFIKNARVNYKDKDLGYRIYTFSDNSPKTQNLTIDCSKIK